MSEEVEAVEEAIDPTQLEEVSAEEKAPPVERYKLNADGEEVEVDIHELKRGYAHQRAANKVYQEGQTAVKQAQALVDAMRDPDKFFEIAKRLGHDTRKISEKYLASQLEDDMLTPEQRELRELKAYKQRREQDEEDAKNEKEEQELSELEAQYVEHYNNEFVSALKESRIPATKSSVAAMARYIQAAAGQKYEMSAKEAAQLVAQDLRKIAKSTFSEADADALAEILGSDVVNKLRHAAVKKIKDPTQFLKGKPQNTTPGKPRKPHEIKAQRPSTLEQLREFQSMLDD